MPLQTAFQTTGKSLFDAWNIGGRTDYPGMAPEAVQEEQARNRREQIARLLLRQGLIPEQPFAPTGRFVAPMHWAQGLAKLAQAGIGGWEIGDIEKERQQAEAKQEERQQEATRAYLAGSEGTPAVPRYALPQGQPAQGSNLDELIDAAGAKQALDTQVRPTARSGVAEALMQARGPAFGMTRPRYSPQELQRVTDLLVDPTRQDTSPATYLSGLAQDRDPIPPAMPDIAMPQAAVPPTQGPVNETPIPAQPESPEQKHQRIVRAYLSGNPALRQMAEMDYRAMERERERAAETTARKEEKELDREARHEDTAARLDQAVILGLISKDQKDEMLKMERESRRRHDEVLLKVAQGKEGPKLKQGEQMVGDRVEAIPGSALYQTQRSASAKDWQGVQMIDLGASMARDKVAWMLDPKQAKAFDRNFGLTSAVTQFMPDDATRNMRAEIDSLKQNLKAFGAGIIRGQGGSPGQITEREWPILEKQIDNLTWSLSPDRARDILDKAMAYFDKWSANAHSTYDGEWKGSQFYQAVPDAPAGPAPGMPSRTPSTFKSLDDIKKSFPPGTKITPIP